MIKYFTVLLAVGLLLTSCKKDKEESCSAVEFPFLKEGNQWTFLYSDWFTDDPDFKITVSEDLGDGQFFVDYSLETGIFPPNQIWKACGGEIVTDDSDPTTPEVAWMKIDYEVGDKWSGGEGNYEVLEKNISLETEAGTFVVDKIATFVTDAINVDTIYQSPIYGRLKYDGLLFSFEVTDMNF